MTSRERYEAWIGSGDWERGVMPYVLWRAAYTAGQEAMRERAAVACDDLADRDYGPYGAEAQARDEEISKQCSVVVRALPVED